MSKTHLVNLLLDAMDELVSKDEIDDAIEQMEAASARTREGAPSGGVTGWGEDPLFELFLRNISHALREAFEELDRTMHKIDDSGTTATGPHNVKDPTTMEGARKLMLFMHV